MFRILLGAALALVSLFLPVSHAQDKLKTEGFGSLSGKVTLVGAMPALDDVAKRMADHADKACCLDAKAKAIEKVDQKWIVDKKTMGVANVVVWVRPPAGTYFEIPAKLLKRNDKIIIDQPHCAFLPYVSAYQPYYFDGKDKVPTGQELIVKNSASVAHNAQVNSGNKEFNGFNPLLIPKSELNLTKVHKGKNTEIVPYVMPYSISCAIHTWMHAKLYVFDHPYYAITKADGTFEIPYVPAGAEIRLMVHHDEHGWVTRKEGELRMGRPITIKAGKKMEIDLEIAPR